MLVLLRFLRSLGWLRFDQPLDCAVLPFSKEVSLSRYVQVVAHSGVVVCIWFRGHQQRHHRPERIGCWDRIRTPAKAALLLYDLLRLQLSPLQSWYHICSATPNQGLTFPSVAEVRSCAGSPAEMATEGVYCNATF
jgi:hypothetical protein